VDGSLKPYRHYREYTDEEIRDEQDEYFANDKTKNALPGLFRDRDDITYWVKDAQVELLDMEELAKLKNSDISSIMTKSSDRGKMLRTLNLMKHYGKDYKRLYKAFHNRYKLPPPLVARDINDDLYLMAGNSRMMMAMAFGFNMPVKIVKYKKTIQENVMDKNNLLKIAKFIIRKHNLKSKVNFSKKSNDRGRYDWQDDIITLAPNPKNMLDFVESVLHEVDHAVMRKKMGSDEYEWKYTKAGQIALDKGKDFYWDNPFEKQAEKYARVNGKKWLKKISVL
jgi:hypothetical protein